MTKLPQSEDDKTTRRGLNDDEKMTKITIFCPKVLKILKTYLRDLNVEGEREIEIEEGRGKQGSSASPAEPATCRDQE